MKREFYAYTDNLKGLLQKATKEEFEYIHKGIDFHIEQYDKFRKEHGGLSTAFSYLHNMQEAIDEDVDKQNQTQRPVKCAKGCSFCCQINVDVTSDEAELIVDYCNKKGIKIDKDKLTRQSEAPVWLQQNAEDRRCVFLGEDGACTVYEVRPSNCRRHMVISEPEDCDAVKHPNGETARFLSIESEMITSAMMTLIKTQTMPKAILDKLD